MFQGFKQICDRYNIDSTWKCFSFEANPYTYMKSRNIYRNLISDRYDLVHDNLAVSNGEGSVAVSCMTDVSDPYASQRSNTINVNDASEFLYRGADPDMQKTVWVKSLDLSEFLFNNVSVDDFVVVKMDIEGAEFDILESIIHSKAYLLIDDLHCEFHEKFFKSEEEFSQRKSDYIKAFTDAGKKVEIWN